MSFITVILCLLLSTASASAQPRQFALRETLVPDKILEVIVVTDLSEQRRVEQDFTFLRSRLPSLWKTTQSIPERPLAQLEAAAGGGEWVEIPPFLHATLTAALEIATWTDGWFDPTAPSPKSWFTKNDYRQVELSQGGASTQARLKRKGMKLDLSFIAAGALVDEVMATLSYDHLSVSLGPVVRTRGSNIHGPWILTIVDHREGTLAHPAAQYNISGLAAAMLRSNSPPIDPVTKKSPPSLCESVTVIASEGSIAEGLAATLYTMGPERGIQWLNTFGRAHAIVFPLTGSALTTKQMPKPLTMSIRERK